MLDRWSVSAVTNTKGKGFRKGKGQKDRQLIMNNYLGIGVDGQVALDFHKVCGVSPCPACLYASILSCRARARACVSGVYMFCVSKFAGVFLFFVHEEGVERVVFRQVLRRWHHAFV